MTLDAGRILLDPPKLFAAPLFRGAPAPLVSRIISGSETRELSPREVLLRFGTENDQLYVVLAGSLSVYLPGAAQPYAQISVGECVGELSVLDGQHVSADVVANEPSVVVCIEREQVWRLVDASAEMARNLLRILAGRIRGDDLALTEADRQRRQFERLATVDPLTGLRNRRWLDDAFARQLARSVRVDQPATAMMIDVDHFKQVNETRGHAEGDNVLKRVAQSLASGLRPQDLLARYGGEEFSVLLPGVEPSNAGPIAERLRAAVAGDTRSAAVPVTISIGIAGRNGDEPIEGLLHRADEALIRAKQAGRDRTSL